MSDGWYLNGQVLVACNCDWGCPCNFNALPTTGKCEGGWVWHVDNGAFEGVVLIDERANAAQRGKIETLVGGKVGGPWGVLGWTWPKVHGPYSVGFDLSFDGINTRIRCGEHLEVQGGAIRNPVSGAESHPGVVLPEGIIFKRGELGSSTLFRVSSGIEYDHSGKYLAVGPFQYAWP
jgi:hypothetical protein